MARQTCSGAQFSPYELDSIASLPGIQPGHRLEIIQLNVAFDSLLQHSMAQSNAHAAQEGQGMPDDSEWEDIPDIDSNPPSPASSTLSSALSSPSPSAPSSRPSSPSASSMPHPHQSPNTAPPQAPPQAHRVGIEAQRGKQACAARRKKRRMQENVARTPYERPPDLRRTQSHREEEPCRVEFAMEDAPASGGGAWAGRRPAKKTPGRIHTLPELEGMGYEYIEWNGRDPKLILDANNRIVAVLLGAPEDPDWDSVVRDAMKEFARARRKAREWGIWEPGGAHRRGRYFSLTTGASFGGGQRRPGNLRNSRRLRRLIRRLLRNKSVRRLAGFQSSGLALYAPKLYRYFCKILKVLFQKHPELIHNFSNSIFPVATFDCGPDAVTFDHCDQHNCCHGWCAVTSGGDFNYKKGGHLYLKQFRLIIEFPSAASMLIPSAGINHGNTPIQRGETRHSMTQYAAGGLFRWVEYGFQSAKGLLSQNGGQALREGFDGVPGGHLVYFPSTKSLPLIEQRYSVANGSNNTIPSVLT